MISLDALDGGSDGIPFVDAHHHLWDLKRHQYAWLEGDGDPDTTNWIGEYSAIRQTYVVEDFLRDTAGCRLTKSVHVQAGWSENDLVGETRWLQAIADRHGIPNGIIAEVDLTAPDVEWQLDRHGECPNFRGVRMLAMSDLVQNPAFVRGFAALNKRHLSYDLNTRVPYMAEGVALARGFPDTLILVDNAGNPMERTDEYFREWRKEMSVLAELPNIVVKLSGLGMSDHTWTTDSMRRWVETAIDLFGTDRSLFASNWPVDGLYSTYLQLIEAYRAITASFSVTEKAAMFQFNAERFYRI